MPHLDEGTLHALLDGALEAIEAAGELPNGATAADVRVHVEQCADCRARLEHERTVRERAGLVLRDAAPITIAAPPLPVPASASAGPASQPARGRPASESGRRSYLPMAWAASLLLAVGAGWWGSQIARDPRMESAAVRESAPQADNRSEGRSISSPSEFGDAAGPSAAQPVTRPATPAATGEPAERETVQRPARATRGETASNAAPASTGTSTGAPAVAAAADEQRPRAGAEPRPEAVPLASAPPPPPPAALENIVVTGLSFQGEQALPSEGAARDFMARSAAGRVAWRPSAGTDVEAFRTDALAIANAEVISREVASEIGAYGFRVRQRLGTGDTVTVTTWGSLQVRLDAVVVEAATADAQAPRRTSVRDRRSESRTVPQQQGAAAAPTKADEPAFVLAAPPAAAGAAVHEMAFHVRDDARWVFVRAPLWLTPVDLAARLGPPPR